MNEKSIQTAFNKNVFWGHLLLTFLIMAICWGSCVLLGVNGLTMNDHARIYLPWFTGGISPAIASYIVLKKSGEATGFKDWIKHVFDFKHCVWAYLLAILFPVYREFLSLRFVRELSCILHNNSGNNTGCLDTDICISGKEYLREVKNFIISLPVRENMTL